MASGKPPLAIIRSPAAIDELHSIWISNAQNHGLRQADAYAQFLADKINQLGVDYTAGKPVTGRADLKVCDHPSQG